MYNLNYQVLNTRTGAITAAFLLRTDAERYIQLLASRDGVHGGAYELILPKDELR